MENEEILEQVAIQFAKAVIKQELEKGCISINEVKDFHKKLEDNMRLILADGFKVTKINKETREITIQKIYENSHLTQTLIYHLPEKDWTKWAKMHDLSQPNILRRVPTHTSNSTTV